MKLFLPIVPNENCEQCKEKAKSQLDAFLQISNVTSENSQII